MHEAIEKIGIYSASGIQETEFRIFFLLRNNLDQSVSLP